MIPLVRYQGMLWALDVRVGGESQLFLLDTAAGLTILDRAFADRVGVRTAGTFQAERMTGEVVTVDLAHDVELTLGERPIVHPVVGVFDLQGLLPAGWPPVGGAIGLPTFEGIPVRIDLPRECLVLDAEPPRLAHEQRVRLQRDGPAVDLFLAAQGPSGLLWLEVDTANTGPAILSVRTNTSLDSGPQTVQLRLEGVGNVAIEAVVKPIRYDGNLGAPFFAAHPLTIDLAEERAWLESTP